MKILIVKLSSMGDHFHALPTVHNLKVALGARIDWVTTSSYVNLVNCFTDVDNVIPFYRRNFLGHFPHFLSQLRAHEYDMVIDLQGLLKSAMVCRLAKTRKRLGPSFHREGSHLLYSAVVGVRNKNRHAVEENLDVIRYLGLEVIPPEFPVAFPEKDLSSPRPRIAICPASRWESKNWPSQRFIEVAASLREREKASLFLLGGAEDRDVCAQIHAALGEGATNLAGEMSLVETGGLLQEMDLLISNDSGPLHMAVATGTPTLAIFGPTDPKRTGPFGEIHRVVRTERACMPCFTRVCPRGDTICLTDLKSSMVVNTARDMLSSC